MPLPKTVTSLKAKMMSSFISRFVSGVIIGYLMVYLLEGYLIWGDATTDSIRVNVWTAVGTPANYFNISVGKYIGYTFGTTQFYALIIAIYGQIKNKSLRDLALGIFVGASIARHTLGTKK